MLMLALSSKHQRVEPHTAASMALVFDVRCIFICILIFFTFFVKFAGKHQYCVYSPCALQLYYMYLSLSSSQALPCYAFIVLIILHFCKLKKL